MESRKQREEQNSEPDVMYNKPLKTKTNRQLEKNIKLKVLFQYYHPENPRYKSKQDETIMKLKYFDFISN